MRILQVFDFLSLPHGGGTVDIVYRLSQALAKRGHEVTICTGDFELDRIDRVNLKVFRSYFNKHGFYIMPSLFKFDVGDYDVVHLHCYRSFQNIVLCSLARHAGKPYIIDAHGSTVELPGRKQLVRKLYDGAFGYKDLKYASRVIAEAEIGILEYKKLGVDSEKIVMLHPFIDIEEFNNLPKDGLFREKYNIKEKYVVMFLGRIHWAKGIDFLLDSFTILNRDREDVRLVIVGQDDGYKLTLEKTIAIRGLSDKVLFIGFLSGQAKLSALVDADILVQPSGNEAGARPSLEAILCDTPVIVTRFTGAGQEIEKMDAGCLVEYGNRNKMAFAIQYMLDFPEESEIKTQKAKQYIKANLSLDKQIVKYEELYEEVVG
jgi:glycosyltransferase involved in cell wall biosynthesis